MLIEQPSKTNIKLFLIEYANQSWYGFIDFTKQTHKKVLFCIQDKNTEPLLKFICIIVLPSKSFSIKCFYEDMAWE